MGTRDKVRKHRASAYSVYRLCMSTHVSHNGGQICAYAMLPISGNIHKNIGKTFSFSVMEDDVDDALKLLAGIFYMEK